MSVCRLRYPACNAHAPYCHLWSAQLYNIFPNYLTKGAIFEKELLNTKCVLWFCLQLLSKTFLILRRKEQYMIKNVYWSSRKVTFIPVQFSWNLNFLDRIFEKYSNIKFHENPPSGSRVVSCGQTWQKFIFTFRKFANMPKNHTLCEVRAWTEGMSVRYELGLKEQHRDRNNNAMGKACPLWGKLLPCVCASVRDGSHNLVTITYGRWLWYGDTARYV